MRYVNIDGTKLRNKMMNRIIGEVVGAFESDSLAERNERIHAAFLDTMGLEYNNIKSHLQELHRKTPGQMALLAALESIDYLATSFAVKHYMGYQVSNEDFEMDEGDNRMTEDALSDAGDTLAETIASMIEDAADRHASEIKQLAKYILKLEKANQDAKREEAKLDDEDFVDEGEDDSEKDKSNPFDDGEGGEESKDDKEDKETSEDSGDGDDPFGDSSSDDDKPKEKKSKESEDDDDPFASSDDEEDGDDPFSSSESDDDGAEDKEKKNDEGDKKEDKKEKSVFESYGFEDESHKGYTEIGLESGDLTRFAKNYIGITGGVAQDMYDTLNQFGVESVEFRKKKDRFITATETAVRSAALTLAVLRSLNIRPDMGRLKYLY